MDLISVLDEELTIQGSKSFPLHMITITESQGISDYVVV